MANTDHLSHYDHLAFGCKPAAALLIETPSGSPSSRKSRQMPALSIARRIASRVAAIGTKSRTVLNDTFTFAARTSGQRS